MNIKTRVALGKALAAARDYIQRNQYPPALLTLERAAQKALDEANEEYACHTAGYVIVTRYEKPNGQVIRHVYGPPVTRSKADTLKRRLVREWTSTYTKEEMDRVEVSVVHLLDFKNGDHG